MGTKKETGETEEKCTPRKGKATILGREPWCLTVKEKRGWTVEMEHKVSLYGTMSFLPAGGHISEAPMKSKGSTSALNVTSGLRVPRVCPTTKQYMMARPPAQSVEKLNQQGAT